jgi:hypothetical protein
MSQAKLVMRDLFDDLVERRLWPVAAVLLVALVAIPVVLSKSPSANPTTPVVTGVPATGPAGTPSPLTAFQPVVTTAQADDRHKNLKRFGLKNPFTPRGINFAAAKAAGNAQPLVSTTTVTGAAGQTGSATPQNTAPGQTQSQTGKTETKFYTYTAKVHFGEEGATKSLTLSQFRALPSSDNPVAIFMGVKRDGTTAVFLMSSSATTTGDGDCKPDESNCTFLYLKKGDSRILETVTADGAAVTYQLDLDSIQTKATSGPAKANTSKHGKATGSSSDAPKAHKSRRGRVIRRQQSRVATVLRSFDRLGF